MVRLSRLRETNRICTPRHIPCTPKAEAALAETGALVPPDFVPTLRHELGVQPCDIAGTDHIGPAAGIQISQGSLITGGRLCLTNGIVSIALAAASLQGRGQPLRPADLGDERALDQAMHRWLGRLMWTAAAYSCAAIVVAAVLFALSYWLLRWPHGRHRAAH